MPVADAAEAELAEADEADLLAEDADEDFDDEADDDADDEADEEALLADELWLEIVAAFEAPPDEPGLSANIAKATIAAKTAMAARMKMTIPPPGRLGAGSNCFTLRGAIGVVVPPVFT